MSFNTEDLFSKLQKKEQASANMPSFNTNTMILKLKVNNSYSLRLLWLPPAGTCKREYPMINQYIHNFWDEQATSGQRGHTVYCPTSHYLKGETKAGFDSCPICAECSKLYKQASEGSSSANKLYHTFRRTFRGYIPVYVVNGPEDVVGTIKILQYGKQINEFLDRKIFGKVVKGKNKEETPIDPSEVIGLEAFIYERDGQINTNGYNLNIQVSSKKLQIDGRQVDMPSYTLDFSRRETNITSFGDNPVTLEYFESINDELSFDNNFFLNSTPAELSNFVLKFMNPESAISEVATSKEPASNANIAVNPYTEKTATTAAPSLSVPTESKDDDIDVDSLIENL